MMWSTSVLGCKHFPPLGSSGKMENALPGWEKPLGRHFYPPGYQWILEGMTVDFSGVANMKNCIPTVWGYLCVFGPFSSADGFLAQPWKLVLSSKISNLSLSFLPGEALGHLVLSNKTSVKVCSGGILSNSTIFRWQILQQRFFHSIQKYLKPFRIGKALVLMLPLEKAEWCAKSCSSRGWAHASQSIVMRGFSLRWFAKLKISGLDGRREINFLVVLFL